MYHWYCRSETLESLSFDRTVNRAGSLAIIEPVYWTSLGESEIWDKHGTESLLTIEAATNYNEGAVQTSVQKHSIVVEHKYSIRLYQCPSRDGTANDHCRKLSHDTWCSCIVGIRRWTTSPWSSWPTDVLTFFHSKSWWNILPISTSRSNEWQWRH